MYGPVECWLNEQRIANILSIPVLKILGYRITYDSDDNFYLVSKGDVTIKFHEDKEGVPYITVCKQGVVFTQTLRESMERYTKKE